ncbi:MAG: hypothetical protein AB8G95_15500 [Anaerolineae bacterium]
MELTCQNCNQQIPEYDYDWKRLAAECGNCGTWTVFSSTPRQYDRVEPDPHMLVFQDYTEADYIEFAQSLEIQRSDDVIVITQHPRKKVMTNLVSSMSAAAALGLSLGFVFLFFALIEESLSLIVPNVAFVIGLLALISPLNHYLNSNVIMIDQDNVYVSARPYPRLNGTGAKERISGYKQFYVTRKSGGRHSYGLFGIDLDNNRKEIIVGDEKFVLLLESEIEKFLKIKDRPVGGGLSNPYQPDSS